MAKQQMKPRDIWEAIFPLSSGTNLKWQKPLEFQRFLFALGQFWAKLLIDEIALLRISWYSNFEHEMAVTMPDSVYYF